jgi:glycosyltransferase involved in cell wall biosynthesis
MNSLGIVQVVDSLDIGGAERVAVNLSNYLTRQGHRSYLCTTRRDGPLDALVDPGVGRVRFARRHTVDMMAVLRFASFLRTAQVHIVHAHGTALFFARAAAALAPATLIWHVHYGHREFDDRPAWPYRIATRGIGGIVAVNRGLAGWARKRLHVAASRVWYLPNFVETSVPDALPELPGSPGRRIVCVANFRPEKDHPNLLQAMALVKDSVPDAHLLLVGEAADSEYRNHVLGCIQQLGLAGSVTWLGARHDVSAILAACDVGVLSSQSEGLPLALLEYGAAGLATVATAVGESPEVLGHGSSGLLVPPNCPEALAGALTRLLLSPGQRREMGGAFRERVTGQYSAEGAGRRLCGIYEDVLRSSGCWEAVQHA